MRVIGIIGSLRHNSVNAAVARTAVEHAPEPIEIELFDVHDIPLYDGDIEVEGTPQIVTELQERVGDADGLIFFTPEYNSSLPAVVKNVIDWLSRPPRLYEGTPVTAVSATPGRRAGAGVLAHFSQIMERQPTRLFSETLGIGSYAEKLDDSGALVEPDTIASVQAFLERFAEFANTPDT